MFRSAVSTFRSGECTFRSGERTFRNAEYKPNTVQRYIKTGYYANIYTTVFIHLPLFNRQRLFSTYYSLYEFRYNMLECVPEMKILAKPNYGWLPLDAQRFNSILLNLQSRGLNVWDKDFNRYLHSQKIMILK